MVQGIEIRYFRFSPFSTEAPPIFRGRPSRWAQARILVTTVAARHTLDLKRVVHLSAERAPFCAHDTALEAIIFLP